MCDGTEDLSSLAIADLVGRSVTLLTVPNADLRRSSIGIPLSFTSIIADVLRYHVPPPLPLLAGAPLPPSSGELITTLYQTTDHVSDDLSAINLTISSSSPPSSTTS
ncbi:hypothetical protein QJS10_CPA01g00348 [Acorus calamus]|uniref:Uncharacterized protein n=1 Tax=Acorus calamus TaxID=4465 RepID=A0AAV9FID7_ACOCL|nr:hypothetical protein QJS10_CPA01g00348 [Acorus calamus]